MMSKLYMKYFVLKPEGNTLEARAARDAMIRYASTIRIKDPEFANEIDEWVRDCERRTEFGND